MDSFSYLEPVCSMSSSNCCFLACIQISQEAGQEVWYSHLSQNFPQLLVIHTVKGFGIVNKAEIDVFLELSCFFHDPVDVRTQLSDFTFTFHFHTLKKEMATHCSVLAWRIPGTRGAWWAAVYGVAQSQTWLKWLSSSSSGCWQFDLSFLCLF